MRTRADIEAYLNGSGYGFDELSEGTFLVEDAQNPGARVVVRVEQDLVAFRLHVMPLSTVKRREALFELLLTLNGTDMVHGAYGVADEHVVMSCVMRLQTLDLEEFRATLDDFSLALGRHRERLAGYR